MTLPKRAVYGAIVIAATVAAGAAIAIPAVATGGPAWRTIPAGAEPASNPLKGFIPYAGDYDTFPYSMEWSYFSLRSVMTGPSSFDWTAVDSLLDEIAARGHQTAMRFYLDYPGEPTGIPQFLLDGGLVTHAYTEFDNATSVIPDYDDPQLNAALDAFIAALGERYDGDPRVGFVQTGLIGFWGEWHTWPYNGEEGLPDYMPSAENQARVVEEFIAAFPHTEVEVRYPTEQNAALDIGYHDDSFALSTKPSDFGWYFGDQLIQTGTTEKWKTNSIGGELRPELQSCIFSTAGCPVIEEGGDNDFPGSVAFTHASWLLNHYPFEHGYTGTDRARALKGAQSLGYSMQVAKVRYEPTVRAGDDLTIGLQVKNVGIAPFYYDWPLTVAFVDKKGHIARQVTTPWALSDIPSGETVTFDGELSTDGLAAGPYTVVIQGTNPLQTGMPVRFANVRQDATVDGWLTLGQLNVKK
jgi:hypothetical protein